MVILFWTNNLLKELALIGEISKLKLIGTYNILNAFLMSKNIEYKILALRPIDEIQRITLSLDQTKTSCKSFSDARLLSSSCFLS